MKQKTKYLFSSAVIISFVLFVGAAYAGVFSVFITGEQELTQNLPVLEFSETGSAPWTPCEDYLWTIPAKSGGYWELGGTYNFHVNCVDPAGLTIYFHDISDDGITIWISVPGDPSTPITSYVLDYATPQEFLVNVEASPYLATGISTASFYVDATP